MLRNSAFSMTAPAPAMAGQISRHVAKSGQTHLMWIRQGRCITKHVRRADRYQLALAGWGSEV